MWVRKPAPRTSGAPNCRCGRSWRRRSAPPWEQRSPRAGLSALAVLVVFGVLAMHSLAGGHHAVHLTPTAANSGETSGHGGHETELVELVAADAVMAAGSAQAAACDTNDCGAGSAGVVCLALLLSLVLATVARRVGRWPASPQRTYAGANAAAYRPSEKRALSPSQLGISRT